MLERLAVEKLHGDKSAAFVLPNFVNCADVGMIQGGGCLRFALESFQGLLILGQVLGKELQGHKTAELDVLGLIYDPHTAAELLNDAVMGNGLADQSNSARPSGGNLRDADRVSQCRTERYGQLWRVD